jgi:hypothetical protein
MDGRLSMASLTWLSGRFTALHSVGQSLEPGVPGTRRDLVPWDHRGGRVRSTAWDPAVGSAWPANLGIGHVDFEDFVGDWRTSVWRDDAVARLGPGWLSQRRSQSPASGREVQPSASPWQGITRNRVDIRSYINTAPKPKPVPPITAG